MTEDEWPACTDPTSMLIYLRGESRIAVLVCTPAMAHWSPETGRE